MFRNTLARLGSPHLLRGRSGFDNVRRGHVLKSESLIQCRNWDNTPLVWMVRGLSAYQASTQREPGQIGPAVVFLFANKREFSNRNSSAALIFRPTITSRDVRFLRLFLVSGLDNRQVRHVRPFFLGPQGLGI